MARLNSGYKINRDSMQQLQTSWCYHLGGCRWLWVGNASTFLSDGDEYGVCT